MTRSAGGDFETDGWMRLPFCFNDEDLARLSKLGPHVGRGVRLTDMQAVKAALPMGFKNSLKKLGFHDTPNRGVGFVKSDEFNWSLPWHQDRVIAMPQKRDHPGYSNWTRKSGVWHCEPAQEILKNIAFAYISFDDINDGKGALEIAEGTQSYGKVPKSEILALVKNSNLVAPNMKAGDVLLISALTLHRSGLWIGTGQRRTLRLDFLRVN